MGNSIPVIDSAGYSPGSVDGEYRILRAGGSEIEVFWNSAISKWVSEPINLIRQVDQDWVTTSEIDWAYFTGSISRMGGWTLKALKDIDAIWAIGFRLQDRASGRLADVAAEGISVAPWYYLFNEQDVIEFANDFGADQPQTWNGHTVLRPPSGTQRPTGALVGTKGQAFPPNIGKGVSLTSDAAGSSAGKEYATAWTDISFTVALATGVPTASPFTNFNKKYLYPSLYAKKNAGTRLANTHKCSAYTYEIRLVG
jgi:hypothetical protein